ncbi:MAG: hypothetical protein K0U78_15160 [Actinomycetia bacterium]|nr:hypothetical protein [Actinomycetes bacterium]
MNINITTNKKTRDVLVQIKDLSKNSQEGIKEGFERMGSGLVRTFQNQILNEPKFGNNYRVRDEDGVVRIHRASAPKQTPALLTGDYFEKVFSKPHGANGLEFGNASEHASYLELGTKHMKARPGLFNAIKHDLKNNRLYLQESMDKHIRS